MQVKIFSTHKSPLMAAIIPGKANWFVFFWKMDIWTRVHSRCSRGRSESGTGPLNRIVKFNVVWNRLDNYYAHWYCGTQSSWNRACWNLQGIIFLTHKSSKRSAYTCNVKLDYCRDKCKSSVFLQVFLVCSSSTMLKSFFENCSEWF